MAKVNVDVVKLQKEFEGKKAEDVLKWAFDTLKDKVGFANSFGAEDVVLTDMIAKIYPKGKIFTLDTGRLPYETYGVWDALEEKYGIRIEPYFPYADAVENMVKENGINCFYKSVELRKMCCKIRKIEPLKRALSGLDAWITGLRRAQAVTRTSVYKIEVDEGNGGMLKLNPLADWSEKDVWDYIKKHKVPYNKLHDMNYPSIGCAPCTRAVKPGEDVRAGRWWWESPDTKECGLHKK